MFKQNKEFKSNKQIISKSNLFNDAYYLKSYRDARIANDTPIDHFIKIGLKEGRRPNGDFDPIWYTNNYEDVKKEKFHSLIHFIQFGIKENRFMNQQEKENYDTLKKIGAFDSKTYKHNYEDLQTQGKNFDFLLHYVRFGKKEGRTPSKLICKSNVKAIDENESIQNTSEEIKVVLDSELFDNNYYLGNYIDVANSGINPVSHYCKHGWKEGRNPSSYFNTSYYLSTYNDVQANNINPLYHFIKSGAKEGRNPSELFDTKFYLRENQDVKRNKMNPLLHYIKHGEEEGRNIQERQEFSAEFCNYLKLREITSQLNVAVVLNVNSLETWQYIIQRLKNISQKYVLYIIIAKNLYKNVIKLEMPKTKVKILQHENAIADVYHSVRIFDYLKKDGINIFCTLQTKQFDIIYKELIEHNIGCNKNFTGIVNAFNQDSNLKFVGPAFAYKNIEKYSGLENEKIQQLEKNFKINKGVLAEKGFFVGSMFWGRISNQVDSNKYEHVKKLKTFKNIKNTDESFNLALEAVLGYQGNKDEKIGLVFNGNQENDYFMEKISDSGFIKNSKEDTLTQLSTFQQDCKLLNKLRFFNQEKYASFFPHLTGHGISLEHHYLTIGQHLINSDLSTQILEAFNYSDRKEKRLSPYLHLGLSGAMCAKDFSDNRNLDYEFCRLKVGINEAHLIDWSIEQRKERNAKLVSIIIPVYGQAELTDNCLDSLMNFEAGLDYEVIVINNGQNSDDIKALEKWKKFANIKIINNEENLNFALGCNLGFNRCVGAKVVFLNNDTTVTKNWLINLVSPLDNQNISITQPKLLYPDGKLQCMGVVFSNKSKLAYPLYQNQDVPAQVLNRNRNFNAVTGACLAVKAEDFVLVKGFDTQYINGQEDIDFCLKLNRFKNTKAMYVANSTVYHYEGKSKGRGKFVANNR